MIETAPLSTYMDRVNQRVASSISETALYQRAPEEDQDSGILKKEDSNTIVNHILCYSGTFNPPPLGHARALHNGVFEANTDFNIVATIIGIGSDENVRWKNAETEETFVMELQNRKILWASQPGLNSRTWLYQPNEGLRWDRTLRGLKSSAEADGFHLRFVNLAGIDHLYPMRRPKIRPDHEVGRIVTDAARLSDSFSREHRQQMTGFTPWEEMEMREDQESKTWRCQQLSGHPYSLYLVLSDPKEEISSTRIREALRKKKGVELADELEVLVANPAQLVKLLLEDTARAGGKEYEKLKDDEELHSLLPQG